MKTYTNCPICNHHIFNDALVCTDYTVSEKEFKLVDCASCGFRFTNPIPNIKDIGNYYESEEYISHSNSNKGIVNRLYQQVRNITLKQKLNLVKRLAKEATILDIGCGTGEFLNICKMNGFRTQGIEPSEKARKQAINNYNLDVVGEPGINNIKPKSFDVVSMWHVLEHVYPLEERVGEIHRVLKNDGIAIVAVPNYDSYDAKIYGKFWAAYDVPRHLYHFKQTDIKKLFENNGFKLKETLPMKFDSYYVSMLSEKYKYGKINLFRSFMNGYLSNLKAKTGKSPGYSSQIYILIKN